MLYKVHFRYFLLCITIKFTSDILFCINFTSDIFSEVRTAVMDKVKLSKNREREREREK